MWVVGSVIQFSQSASCCSILICLNFSSMNLVVWATLWHIERTAMCKNQWESKRKTVSALSSYEHVFGMPYSPGIAWYKMFLNNVYTIYRSLCGIGSHCCQPILPPHFSPISLYLVSIQNSAEIYTAATDFR